MKYTLLDMTQSILSSLSSDEVNSISDTTESMQVAQIIKQKYFDIITRVPMPEHEQLVQLDSGLDDDTPVLMYVPEGVSNISWLKYFNSSVTSDTNTSTHGVNVDVTPVQNNVWGTTSSSSVTIGTGTKVFTVTSSTLDITIGDQVVAAYTSGTSNYMSGTVTGYSGTTLTINVTLTNGTGTYAAWTISGGSQVNTPTGYEYVYIIPVQQFIEMTNGFNPSQSNVESFTFTDSAHGFPGTYTFYYRNDRQPTFCCIINDYYVIFDSYDSSLDSVLQNSKTMAWGRIIPQFLMEDNFTMDLSENQFSLLLNEAKALAFFELKQSAHPKAEQEIKRGWSTIQRDKEVATRPTYFDQLPDFGRQGNFGYTSYFKYRGWDRP